MSRRWNHKPRNVLIALEAEAVSARGGFGCLFSSSDEYEAALITERRAQGRYAPKRSRWPTVAFLGCILMMAGAVLVFW